MATTTAPTPDPHTTSIEQMQLELRAIAASVERLRQNIQTKGAGVTKEEMAEFAKRQKAYLDRKIEFEKHRKTVAELPTPPLVQPNTKNAEPPAAGAPDPTRKETSKPATRKPSTRAAETKKASGKIRAASPEKSASPAQEPVDTVPVTGDRRISLKPHPSKAEPPKHSPPKLLPADANARAASPAGAKAADRPLPPPAEPVVDLSTLPAARRTRAAFWIVLGLALLTLIVVWWKMH